MSWFWPIKWPERTMLADTSLTGGRAGTASPEASLAAQRHRWAHGEKMVLRADLTVYALAGALSLALLWGCASRSAAVLPGVSVPGVPQNVEEALIADALTRALVDEHDFPDYGALRAEDTLIVMSEYHSGQAIHRFGPGALPHLSSFHFVLLTGNEVEQAAAERGHLAYLSVEIPDITSQPTTIEVRLANRGSRDLLLQRSNTVDTYEPIDNMIVQRRPDIVSLSSLSSNSYVLSYRRVGDGWQFVKVVGQINRN